MDTEFVTEQITLETRVGDVQSIVYANGAYHGKIRQDELANLVTGQITAQGARNTFQGMNTAWYTTQNSKVFEVGVEEPIYEGAGQIKAIMKKNGILRFVCVDSETRFRIITNPGKQGESERIIEHEFTTYPEFDAEHGYFSHSTLGTKWLHVAPTGKVYEREFERGYRRIPKTPILIANQPDEKGYYHARHVRTNKRLVFPTPPQVALGQGSDYAFLSIIHLNGKLQTAIRPAYTGQETEALANMNQRTTQQHEGRTKIPNLVVMKGGEIPTARFEYVHPDPLRQVGGQAPSGVQVASKVVVYTRRGRKLDHFLPILENGEHIVGCSSKGEYALALLSSGRIAEQTGSGQVLHSPRLNGRVDPDFILRPFEGGYLTLSADKKTVHKTTRQDWRT